MWSGRAHGFGPDLRELLSERHALPDRDLQVLQVSVLRVHVVGRAAALQRENGARRSIVPDDDHLAPARCARLRHDDDAVAHGAHGLALILDALAIPVLAEVLRRRAATRRLLELRADVPRVP